MGRAPEIKCFTVDKILNVGQKSTLLEHLVGADYQVENFIWPKF